MNVKIGIIGAGASGMMAAVTAADKNAEVTLFERNKRAGKKLLATGNGKCNLSNLDFGTDKYYCKDKEKLQRFFSAFSNADTVAFFEKNGMMLREKNGYLYPYSEQASTVLEIWEKLLKEKGISVLTEADITGVYFHKKKKRFIVENHGREYEFQKLILSTGGPASLKKSPEPDGFAMAESFGHTIQKLMPGLVQLRSPDTFLKGMAGVRATASVGLLADNQLLFEETGEVQFTDYGVSGIPVFQCSRQAGYALDEGKEVTVLVNFFPKETKESFADKICHRREQMQNLSMEEFLLGLTNGKINMALLKYAGITPDTRVNQIKKEKMLQLTELYLSLPIHITALNGMENAQVCAGGVDLKEVDDSLQSRLRSGLYLTGELLDVDGKCGGYNLQWAWTSGYIAGSHAAEKPEIITEEMPC